jgi:small ligand-binding sensory domain FIST
MHHRATWPGTGGPRAASAMVTHESWAVALEHATDKVLHPGDPAPDVLLLFASPSYGEDYAAMLAATRDRTRAGVVFGCSASGFLAGPHETEDRPGLAVMALWLPGATLVPLRLHQEHLDLLDDPESWPGLDATVAGEITSWLVFAEPYRFDTQAFLRKLQHRFPGTAIMGGMASGMISERRSCVFFDDHWYDEGAIALGFGTPYRLVPHVSQGCAPIGETWTITGTERNVLLSISNRPALQVLQETVDALPDDLRLVAQRNLVVGLAGSEYRDDFHRGDFAVRGILGIDQAKGSVAIGGLPRVGQTLQFHLRHAASAHDDLKAMLARAVSMPPGADPVAAVLCTCDGRGQSLFGKPDHDAGVTSAALGAIPLAGAFCIGEIGPLGDQVSLHGFTATLGILQRAE